MAKSIEKRLAEMAKKAAAAKRANEREIKRIEVHQKRTQRFIKRV